MVGEITVPCSEYYKLMWLLYSMSLETQNHNYKMTMKIGVHAILAGCLTFSSLPWFYKRNDLENNWVDQVVRLQLTEMQQYVLCLYNAAKFHEIETVYWSLTNLHLDLIGLRTFTLRSLSSSLPVSLWTWKWRQAGLSPPDREKDRTLHEA